MTSQNYVIGIVGSPNPEGRTNELVTAALIGAKQAGAETELIQMSDHVVAPCKDCLPWVCLTNLKCSYKDEAYEFLSEKVLNCGDLILGTPVYWWDTSAMVKYFILKMFRVYAHTAPLQGLPALGIGIAGGTGNGLISGLRPVYQFFQMMQMRAIDPIPSTRFNFAASLERAQESGRTIAGMSRKRSPFAGLEERLLWYDALPYLGLNRSEERRLLADLTTMSLPDTASAMIAGGMVRADVLAAAGHPLEALIEVTKVYEASIKVFDAKSG
jgi:NAD(P)H-dependent FMN reductase